MTAHLPHKISGLPSKEIQLGNPKMPLSYAAFACDTDCLDTIRAANEGYIVASDSLHLGGIAQAVRTVSETNAPKIIVVDLSDSSDPKKDIGDLSQVCEAGTILIALGNINDIQFYRSLSQIGVFDYLQKPLNKDDYRAVIQSAVDALSSNQPKTPTKPRAAEKVVGIVGVRGGLGASSIAINMGWMLAHTLRAKTTLLDLDLQFGTSALAFDLEPGRGLRDALEHPSRIDSLFIERAAIQQSETLSILGTESPISAAPPARLDSINILTKAIKSKGHNIIVDVPRQLIAQEPRILESLDMIIVVSNLTLAATRDTIRFLEHFRSVAPDLETKIALNKVERGDENEIALGDFETSVGSAVSWKIPRDNKTFRAAIHDAKSLYDINSKARCTTAIATMVQDTFAAEKSDTKPAGFLKRLFSSDPS